MQRKSNGTANESEKRVRPGGIAPETGKLLSGFRVEGATDIQDLDGRLWKMVHGKSGATLFWMERKEEVKSFFIAFRTLPEDDTGAAHILEHAVLQGSEKHPLKSPFNELRRSSMQVRMNAETSPDSTCYHFSTRIDADFLNLADVYLDAVFHPLVLKDPRRFRQEGWHYEVDGATGELSVNGIVFNELKGKCAAPCYIARREMVRALHPGTVYARVAGGTPEAIPDLTHGALCAFHRRFYHPSNALAYLDGKVPLGDILEKLDACFSAYDRKPVAAEIPLSAPVGARVRIPYESAECDHKALLSLGWSAGDVRDPAERLAMMLLETYCCSGNEAPLTKALLSKGLCKSVYMDSVQYRQSSIILDLEDLAEEDAGACRETVMETFGKICREGFDRERLRRFLDAMELAMREGNAEGAGMSFFAEVRDHWMYGFDLRAELSFSRIFAEIRARLEDGLFERIVREKLLENPHRAEVLLVPDAGLARRNRDAWKARMAAVRNGMTPERLAAVAREAAELEACQRRKDPPEAVARIPRLARRDLPPHGTPVPFEKNGKDWGTEILVPAVLPGVFHATLYFPMGGFTAEELPRMPLFSCLPASLATARRGALDLQTALMATAGGFKLSPLATDRGRFLAVSLSGLTAKAEAAFGLLTEILLETRYDAVPEIGRILRQMQLGAEQDIAADGVGFALSHLCRGLSESNMADDLLHGELQLRWLQGATADDNLAGWLAGVPGRLFRRGGLVVSRTANLPDAVLEGFLGTLPESPALPPVRIEPVPGETRGFAIEGDTGCAVWMAQLPEGVEATGAMAVAARILSMGYLQNEVREIGGAYDSRMFVSPTGTVHCQSYRDPAPARSLEIMGRVGRALREFAESGADIDRYVVMSVAKLDPLRSPGQKAGLAASLLLDGRTPEDEERWRREILGTTREQLLEFADILDRIAPSAKTCIVGGPRQLAHLPPQDVRPIIPSR